MVTICSQMSRLERMTPVASSGLEVARLGMSPCTHSRRSGGSGTSIDSSCARSAVIVAKPPVPVSTPSPWSGGPLLGRELLEELHPVDELVDVLRSGDAGLAERHVVDPGVAGHRPRVRLGHRRGPCWSARA